jgi:hypothetical protein
MTEMRYLIFVPAICRAMERLLERKRSFIEDPYRRSREMQDQLRNVLAKTYNNELGHGVIGIIVDQPERYPSAIYWAALRALGILRWQGHGESAYFRRLLKHHDVTRVDENHGDPVAELAPQAPNWAREFPYFDSAEEIMDTGGRFHEGLTFDLTSLEASYLRDCYLGDTPSTAPIHHVHSSLLAHLIRNHHNEPFQYPWDVSAPSHLETAVEDAKRFSAFVRGATLQYYHYLVEDRRAQGWQVPDADIRGWFGQWWNDGRVLLEDWDTEGFLRRRATNIRPYRGDDAFLLGWKRQCLIGQSASAFLGNGEARRLIVERERRCKPSKARLTYLKHLRSWTRRLPDSPSQFQLTYRADKASLFVRRVAQGLESATKGKESAH